MKEINVGLWAIAATLTVLSVGSADSSPLNQGHRMLGEKNCSRGSSFWCSNLINAKDCKAVRHCLQTVWEKHHVPTDNDSICQICKNMVTQARDQLRSNETMEELKEVFEGSCNLIPIKVVKKECCKLADGYIPELVEALSSQMNPDQVCTVAGLCNNAEIDRLLMKYYSAALDGTLKEEDDESTEIVLPSHEATAVATETPKKPSLNCGICNSLAELMANQFQSANPDDVLDNILHGCGQMGSFSDACANIALVYFDDIYKNLKDFLHPVGVCHMSGVCAAKYHQHPEDPKDEKLIDLLASGNDDIPCELCEQLVQHLRDVLVANTTETEFKQVLEGLCNQTKGFRPECLSIVDQYYDVAYETLVNNLDASGACFLIGICPKQSTSILNGGIIRPLLPVFPPAEIKVTVTRSGKKDVAKSMNVPFDDTPMHAANPERYGKNANLCVFCEYFLHFVQESLATDSTEEEIKQIVNRVCDDIPSALKAKCHDFVDAYGDAIIALLIQELDPREVCPKLQMCPTDFYPSDVEIFYPQHTDEQDKPTCPLCLFAVAEAQSKITDNKSKKNIEYVLKYLCKPLTTKLKTECVDFVQTYSSELIDMLITDFKAQEICVALKLCQKSSSYLDDMAISMESESAEIEDLAINEIDDSDETPVDIVFLQDNEEVTPNCLLCIEIIKLAEKRLNKHTTKEDIEKALNESCLKLRKNLQPKCHQYIDKYGDKIATLLLKEMDPKIICAELGLCLHSEQEDLEIDEALKYDVIAMPNTNNKDHFVGMDEAMSLQETPTCVLCEFVMTKLEMELKNTTEQDEIKRTIHNICNHMPSTVKKSCDKFVEEYAETILDLLSNVPPKQICQQMQLCLSSLALAINDDVIECGICYGASVVLLPYLREHTEHQQIKTTELISVGCENLPAKYYQSCSEMMRIYGKSIMNLSERIALDESHICTEIGKCFRSEKSSLAFARISA